MKEVEYNRKILIFSIDVKMFFKSSLHGKRAQYMKKIPDNFSRLSRIFPIRDNLKQCTIRAGSEPMVSELTRTHFLNNNFFKIDQKSLFWDTCLVTKKWGINKVINGLYRVMDISKSTSNWDLVSNESMINKYLVTQMTAV